MVRIPTTMIPTAVTVAIDVRPVSLASSGLRGRRSLLLASARPVGHGLGDIDGCCAVARGRGRRMRHD